MGNGNPRRLAFGNAQSQSTHSPTHYSYLPMGGRGPSCSNPAHTRFYQVPVIAVYALVRSAHHRPTSRSQIPFCFDTQTQANQAPYLTDQHAHTLHLHSQLRNTRTPAPSTPYRPNHLVLVLAPPINIINNMNNMNHKQNNYIIIIIN